MVYDHVLTIGATGMLSGATYELALKTNTLTCMASTARSLKVIEGGLDRHGPTYHPLQIDYTDTQQFMDEIKQTWKKQPFSLVLAWFHNSGSESLRQLLNYLDQQPEQTGFYHVMGSAAADPTKENIPFVPNPKYGLRYHQIILGFHITSDGRSRWLHHGEINNGVLEAIRSGRQRTIVGTVEPWSARP